MQWLRNRSRSRAMSANSEFSWVYLSKDFLANCSDQGLQLTQGGVEPGRGYQRAALGEIRSALIVSERLGYNSRLEGMSICKPLQCPPSLPFRSGWQELKWFREPR